MIEQTREGTLYHACNGDKAFSLLKTIDRIKLSCQNVFDTLSFLLDNIYIKYGSIYSTEKMLVF